MASFRKRGEKWEYRVRYIDPSTGKQREKSKGGFRSKKDAQIEAAEIEKQLYFNQHSVIQNQDIVVKDWLNEYGPQCQPSTLENRKNYINNQIIPNIGHYRLSNLKRLDYEKFLNELLKKYAKTTVQTIHSIFSTAINKAVELEMLTHNKYQNISLKKENEFSEEDRNYLTRDEVNIFMGAAKKSQFHHYIIALLLLRTGLRKGEMLALSWHDIDLDNKTLAVTKSRNEFGVKKPKTTSSIRTIGIDDTLVEELKKYKTWQKKNRMKYGANYQDSNFMIVCPNGTEMGTFGVNRVMESILRKTNLHRISPHGLRHTHAIMLLESGVDIKTVSERLGHTTINMTADVYLHITKKHEEESVLKLERYLNN
ncbi:tyrosine-type recombinase/integrase [Metabacillus fastidiosus]|uniref:site-specific integrase n=1 Tax=Metabacillus fastidiosus TaxID=1458 RepID=UPI003D2DF071